MIAEVIIVKQQNFSRHTGCAASIGIRPSRTLNVPFLGPLPSRNGPVSKHRFQDMLFSKFGLFLGGDKHGIPNRHKSQKKHPTNHKKNTQCIDPKNACCLKHSLCKKLLLTQAKLCIAKMHQLFQSGANSFLRCCFQHLRHVRKNKMGPRAQFRVFGK